MAKESAKKIKLILLDGYGVMMSDGYPDTARVLVERYGGKLKETHDAMYRWFDRAAVRQLSQREAWQRAIDELQLPMTVDQLHKLHIGLIKLNLPMIKLAKQLQQRYRLVMLSKNTRVQFTDTKKKHPALFKFFGRHVINTFELNLPKASEETMRYIFKKYKVRAHEVVFIEDRPSNIQGALNVGVNVILYKTFTQTKRELEKLLGEKL